MTGTGRARHCLTAVVLTLAAIEGAAAMTALEFGRYKPRSLYLESGVSRDRVYAVVRDEQGYLWLGTDNGLKRYDGYNLKVYAKDPDNPRSLARTSLGDLLIDSEGTLWVGSGGALSAYNPDDESFDNYFITDNRVIWDIVESPPGMLWVAGESFGLVGFDARERKVIYRSADDQSMEWPISPTGLKADQNDPEMLWLTSRSGLYRFDTRTHEFRHFFSHKATGGPRTQLMEDLIQLDNGEIWIASGAGLFAFDPSTERVRHYRREPGKTGSLATDDLVTIFRDSKDRVWIGTDKNGVHLYRPGTDDFMHIPASKPGAGGFQPAAVSCIYEDGFGSLWFCVSTYGVQRISAHLEKFTTIGAGEGERELSFDSVLDLLEDRRGRIWIATDGGGLNRLDPESGTIIRYRHDPDNPRTLSSDSVLSLEEDERGMLWVGTWAGGVNRFNPETGEAERFMHDPDAPLRETIAGNNIFRVVKDADGWLWLSVWRTGLQRLHPESGRLQTFLFKDKDDPSDLTNWSVSALEPSRQGHWWIGGYAGLEKYDPGTQHFTMVPGMGEGNEIFGLYEDAQGVLWAATSTGLVRYDPADGGIVRYSRRDGLADPFVASMEQDNRGRLWLGTRGGLSVFDPRTGRFESFDENSGLAATQFNRFSHLKTRNGIMYFGGSKGLTVFDPDDMPDNNRAPNVVVTGVELFQKPLEPGASPYLPRQVSRLERLTLPYEQRDITFAFSALSFIAPQNNRYRYRLEGLEHNWTEVGSSRRLARYTNLDPGHYRFHVTGSNNDGVWNTEGAAVNLTILAPWWMTWWARLLGAILALCAVYGFIRWRLRLNRRRERELSIEIEERRAAEAKLFHIAYHDSLTGLHNRLWLLERLELLIERAAVDRSLQFALLFLDGDRFKQINDTHGHQLGDRILVGAAERLKALLPEHCHAIRLGGDEFTILVEAYVYQEDVVGMARTIIESFNQPFHIEKNLMFFRVSIGMVFCRDQYSYPGQILRDADIAMYKAKELGRGVCQVFDARMREQTRELTQLEADLYTALTRNELTLVYQPIVDLESGDLVGFEALVRWHHPEKGPISPAKFIPIAEESGLIIPLGSWVLRQACAQLAAWIGEFQLEKRPTMSINLSSLELGQSYFLEHIDEVLADTGIDADLIKLEITESTLMENTESMNVLLEELRARRIELAIDDFGTGYSSLSYLDRLPVQVLKIDRQFINTMGGSGDQANGPVEIIKATISLAHSLKIMVVAEGIETAQQYRLLRSYGCDYGQGYYIAKPLSADEAARFICRDRRPHTTVRVAANDVPVPPVTVTSRRRFRGRRR